MNKVLKFFLNNRNLVKNIRALLVLQLLNYVLPLVTMPYVVRVIGIEKFGVLAFGVAVAGYCNLICDYGFNLSATREISLNRNARTELQKIYSHTLTVKCIIFAACFFLLLLLTSISDLFFLNINVLFASFSLVLAQVLFPVWFFQGMEDMAVITRINVLSKMVFTVLIFLCVKTADDFLLVPILTATGYLAGSIFSLYYVRKHYRIGFVSPSIAGVAHAFKTGFPLFLSSISISLYTLSAPIILSFTSPPATVGAFSSAEKLVSALKAVFSPLTQAFYPFMSGLFSSDVGAGFSVVRTVLLPLVILAFFVSFSLWLFAESLVLLLFGAEFYEAVVYLEIMSVIPALVLVSNILGIQMMLNLGYQRQFTAIISSVGLISIIFSVFMARFFDAAGVAGVLVATELSVVAFFFLFMKSRWNGIANEQ